MKAAAKLKMDADEFLAWADCQESGHYQLLRGEIVAMAPECAEHSDIKRRVANALEAAIKDKGLKCQAFVDGPGVRIDNETVFEPDALVNCSERVPRASLIAPNPIIVAEVVSPSSEPPDLAIKLKNYFRHPSIQHYILVIIEDRSVLHHRRGEAGTILTSILDVTSAIAFDPPGMSVFVSSLFGEDYGGDS